MTKSTISCGLVIFTEEIRNGKLHFSFSVEHALGLTLMTNNLIKVIFVKTNFYKIFIGLLLKARKQFLINLLHEVHLSNV